MLLGSALFGTWISTVRHILHLSVVSVIRLAIGVMQRLHSNYPHYIWQHPQVIRMGDSANFIIVYCSNYLYAFTHKHTYAWREKKRYLHTHTHTKREEEILTHRERHEREKEGESCISCTLAGWQKDSLCSWRMTLNFWFFRLQLLSAGVIGMCYHAKFMHYWRPNRGLYAY